MLGYATLLKPYRTYCRLYWHRIPSPYLLPGNISLVLLLRAICRLWHPLTHGQGIPYIFNYNTALRHPTDHLHGHKVVAVPGPPSRDQRPQVMLILTKYPEPTQAPTKLPQQTSELVQMSPTGVDTSSIVSSPRRSSRSGAVIGPNRSESQPNIFNRRWSFDNLCQVASTLIARL